MMNEYNKEKIKKNPYAESRKQGYSIIINYGPGENAWDDTKEKIKALLEVLPSHEADRLLSYIVNNFNLGLNESSWDEINKKQKK